VLQTRGQVLEELVLDLTRYRFGLLHEVRASIATSSSAGQAVPERASAHP
jgi:hypothetical protein